MILPVYNSERYIGEAVESLEGQTSGDFEVLCNAYAERAYFLPDTLDLYRVDNAGSSVRSNEKYMAVKHEQDWIRGQLADRGLLNGDTAAFLKSFKINVYRWHKDRLEKEYREKFLLEIRDETGREYLGDGDGDRTFYREREEDIRYLRDQEITAWNRGNPACRRRWRYS